VTLHESASPVVDEAYVQDAKWHSDAQAVGMRLLDVLVLSRVNSILDMAMSFGRSDDDVWRMVATASQAFRSAKDRALGALHAAASATMPLDTLGELVQPYLSGSAGAGGSNRSEFGDTTATGEALPAGAVHLRRAIMAVDDRAQRDMHTVALGLLAHSACAQQQPQQQPFASRLRLGRVEVVLSHKGEVLRSLCVRSDGSVVAVCSSRCVREAKCRPDAVSVVGAGHHGMAAALIPSGLGGPGAHGWDAASGHHTSTGAGTPQQDRARDRLTSSSRELSEDDSSSQQGQGFSIPATVEALLDMLWQGASTNASEVVHVSSDQAVLGSATSLSGAMALATHPWLPVFVSGGADGSVLLHGFGAPQPLSAFGTLNGASSAAAICRLRFDSAGAKFCGGDSAGAPAAQRVDACVFCVCRYACV
jgi:hypothetical protein